MVVHKEYIVVTIHEVLLTRRIGTKKRINKLWFKKDIKRSRQDIHLFEDLVEKLSGITGLKTLFKNCPAIYMIQNNGRDTHMIATKLTFSRSCLFLLHRIHVVCIMTGYYDNHLPNIFQVWITHAKIAMAWVHPVQF
jgi:hypothetical protein